jgi:hydroxypyruvate reductase
VGAGKAAARMAQAVEHATHDGARGFVVTPHGYALPTRAIEVIEAAHPTPDRTGEGAARRALDLAAGLGADAELIVLLSGGASALWAAPAPGVDLAEKQALTRTLLASGAGIAELNAVRKHISAIKGGRLALAAAPARVLTLAVSDVPGDDPAVIGSGPTAADPTTRQEAVSVLKRYGITPSPAIARALADPANETPKPGDPRLARSRYELILAPRAVQAAVAEAAQRAGYQPIRLGDALSGEAREVAADQARLAIKAARTGRRCALISGGELNVTDSGQAPGGRCREYALALAVALAGAPGVWAAALDTDGIDGAGGQAGGMIGPDTLQRAKAAGLDPGAMLDRHESGAFFDALGDAIVTGPTGTNLADLRIVLVG